MILEETKPDERFFPLIFNTISHGIFTTDGHGRITSFNKMAEAITEFKKEEALGHPCSEIFKADICESACALRHSIRTGERVEDREVTIQTKTGRQKPIAISTAALIAEDGAVMGGVEMFRDLSTLKELRKKLQGTYVFEDIVSKSRAMKRVIEMLPLVANSMSTALIEGASGTGKELVARAIHNLGPRHMKPFVALNCGALPDNLLESELFGYKKGAFTDAKEDKPGRFAMAQGGTLFLDEVGDLSPTMQVKLLRVLQEREYEPLGGTKTIKTDVRVIAATHRDLETEVYEKRFRQDLYFRLNVVKIALPPLTERREDIPLLIQHFIDRFNALQGRHIERNSERAMAVLMGYAYPGNIRELENAIEHAFVLCAGDTIQVEDLPPHIWRDHALAHQDTPKRSDPLKSAEAETIMRILAKHNGNRNRAAAELGISRNTLWRKLKRFRIVEDRL